MTQFDLSQKPEYLKGNGILNKINDTKKQKPHAVKHEVISKSLGCL
jgi:hypothetical protein